MINSLKEKFGKSGPTKVRITLSVDKDVWHSCRQIQEDYPDLNISWSAVAENTFREILEMVNIAKVAKAYTGSSEQTLAEGELIINKKFDEAVAKASHERDKALAELRSESSIGSKAELEV